MKDIGVSCAKTSYGRTAGKPMKCAPGLENRAGLCYKPCKAGWKGVGPVCWSTCPKGSTDCGALCLAPGNTNGCAGTIGNMAKNAFKAVEKATDENPDYKGSAKDAGNFAKSMTYPKCQ